MPVRMVTQPARSVVPSKTLVAESDTKRRVIVLLVFGT